MLNREKVEEAMDRLAEDFGIPEAFRNSPTWWTLIELAGAGEEKTVWQDPWTRIVVK